MLTGSRCCSEVMAVKCSSPWLESRRSDGRRARYTGRVMKSRDFSPTVVNRCSCPNRTRITVHNCRLPAPCLRLRRPVDERLRLHPLTLLLSPSPAAIQPCFNRAWAASASASSAHRSLLHVIDAITAPTLLQSLLSIPPPLPPGQLLTAARRSLAAAVTLRRLVSRRPSVVLFPPSFGLPIRSTISS